MITVRGLPITIVMRYALRACLAIAFGCALIRDSLATVIVVTNRTAKTVSFRLGPDVPIPTAWREFTLEAGDCIPIPLTGTEQISFDSKGQAKRRQVRALGLFYFGETPDGQLELGQIGLSSTKLPLTADLRSGEGSPTADAVPARPTVVIPVKILFDDVEVASRKAWEARLRKRFENASLLFKKFCFVDFQIDSIDSWHSDPTLTGLNDALSEFERLVDPAPARVAIGFTAQQRKRLLDPHLGGTRGPLHTHMLIREQVNKNSEPECLEVLVHELGHLLGAVHSPEPTSVMRIVLGDRRARSSKFRIVFDPLNTLAMCLVSDELRARPQLRFRQLQPSTREELCKIYVDLARASPNDSAAPLYLRWLGFDSVNLPIQGNR